MRIAQQGIAGQKFTALRDVFDEAEVHRHVTVAALPRVVRAVHHVQHMGVQKIKRHGGDGQHTRPERPAVGVLRHAAQPRAVVQKRPADRCCPRRAQQHGGHREAEHQCEHRRQHGQ